MKDRNRKTFKKAFAYVRKRLALLGYNMQKKSENDKRIAAFDYEIAEREEYCIAFCIDVCQGCFMHFSNNIYTNMISYELKPALDYSKKKNRAFFHAYRQVKCIGLLPIHLQRKGWSIVKAKLKRTVPNGFKRALNNWITNYFELYYISGKHFALSDWNFWDEHNRTQGKIESGHKIWHHEVGSHPLIWKFVMWLQRIDALARLKYERIQANGGKTKLKKADEREKEDHLNRLWHCLHRKQISITIFLNCAAVAINMNWKLLQSLYEKYEIAYFIHNPQ